MNPRHSFHRYAHAHHLPQARAREFSTLLLLFAAILGATYLLLWKPLLERLGM